MKLNSKIAVLKNRLKFYIKSHRETHSTERLARDLAYAELKSHLDTLNGNQKLMREERGDFVRRDWFESQHAELSKRVSALELGNREYEGSREPIKDLVKWAAQIFGSLIILGIGWIFGHFVMK